MHPKIDFFSFLVWLHSIVIYLLNYLCLFLIFDILRRGIEMGGGKEIFLNDNFLFSLQNFTRCRWQFIYLFTNIYIGYKHQ